MSIFVGYCFTSVKNRWIHKAVSTVHLDKPAYKDDVQHLSSIHILAQKRKFDHWLKSL